MKKRALPALTSPGRTFAGTGPAAMSLKWLSVLAFGGMIAGLAWMVLRGEALARSAPAIAVQGLAVLLMVMARAAFGARSFHAAANPTAGTLVTHGPYSFLRHPIYAAVLYFAWAAAIDYRSPQALAAATLITAGAAARMYAEETLLAGMYPGYDAYRARTARVIPFVF